MTPRSFSHIALSVRDFDRSLHFYRDLLGFQVT
jgi:catechol 2,3-dioxygenase-like lactoylglutathione lyase family enzyme